MRALVVSVDTETLALELGGTAAEETTTNTLARLRVAAALSLAELLGTSSADMLIRVITGGLTKDFDAAAHAAYQKWDAYLDSLLNAGQEPSLDDLLAYAGTGLAANQPAEVRAALRGRARPTLDRIVKEGQDSDWPEQVRRCINAALLLLIRQNTRDDVSLAGAMINTLASAQREMESNWLDRQPNTSRDALSLLGYYHLAQAVTRTSEFLLAGSVMDDGKLVYDIGAELRRLLIRADEYLGLSGDAESQTWVNLISALLWRMRTDSVWVSGRDISERINQLLTELAKGERERHVFSLLPSQQDALRANLMDASRVAIVLQMPTSAGKTLLAEFSILQTIDAFGKDSRIVYVVPTRALATQTLRSLTEDLRPLGINVMAAGSAFEEDPYELQILSKSDGIVIATPEKLDLLLRSHPEWFETLRLVVVDEAHLLQDSERGVRLELLLANIRRERPQARLLLLTPFVENAQQIATWLGGARGLPVQVQWRPSRLLLGITELRKSEEGLSVLTHWKEPYRDGSAPQDIELSTDISRKNFASTEKKVVFLAKKFENLGTVLALYTLSKPAAEKAASIVAQDKPTIPLENRPAALRVAIAIAQEELGDSSALAACLERGVAFHHSALSSMMRYLIEDQVRVGTIKFISATTTLAQGMNFPVAAVIVHSVNKPYGGGRLAPAEFWNIAGRAGRVGMVDRGIVLFADEKHKADWEFYSGTLQGPINSALLKVLKELDGNDSLKDQYRRNEAVRPFIQFLAHAAATSTPQRALDNLEELLQSSLANAQITQEVESSALRNLAKRYLEDISDKRVGFLKVSDSTGLGSFSFDQLYASIRNNSVLSAGPSAILQRGQSGMAELVEVLRWLPELELAIGKGQGPMDVQAVARVVTKWLAGERVIDIASEFPGTSQEDKVRKAASYVFSKVSQTFSWGAHAYLKGWGMNQPESSDWQHQESSMLPAYIQYGVHTPEAVVASLFSVPRQLAEPMGSIYREEHGKLSPDTSSQFRDFIETADSTTWSKVVSRSSLANSVSAADLRTVWRQMQGLTP